MRTTGFIGRIRDYMKMYPENGAQWDLCSYLCELRKEIALVWDSIEYSLYNKFARTEPVHKEATFAATEPHGNSVIPSRVIKFT